MDIKAPTDDATDLEGDRNQKVGQTRLYGDDEEEEGVYLQGTSTSK